MVNKATLSLIILFLGLAGQNIKKEINRSFVANKDTRIIVRGEIDVIIENWNKDDVAINAKLDLDLKNVFSFEKDGKHDIIIKEDGPEILILRKKPSSTISFGSFYRDRSKIIINMPDWVDLSIDIDDASFIAEKLSGNVEIKGEDGNIVINELLAQKSKIKFSDGSFKCGNLSGTATITFDDGSVSIANSYCRKLIAHFDDGSFKAQLNKDSDKTFIEFNDGSANLTLNSQFSFHITAEMDDGRLRNRTELNTSYRDESKVELGDKDASNEIQAWFDDGTLTIREGDY